MTVSFLNLSNISSAKLALSARLPVYVALLGFGIFSKQQWPLTPLTGISI